MIKCIPKVQYNITIKWVNIVTIIVEVVVYPVVIVIQSII